MIAIGVCSSLDAVGRSGLGVDAGDVLGDSVRADEELLGDLRVRLAGGEMSEDLELTSGKAASYVDSAFQVLHGASAKPYAISNDVAYHLAAPRG